MLTMKQKKAIRVSFKNLTIPRKNLAADLGSSVAWLNNVAAGKQVSPKRAREIEKLSKRQITKEILRPDVYC